MARKRFQCWLERALSVALVLGVGVFAYAQSEPAVETSAEQSTGKIVRIAPVIDGEIVIDDQAAESSDPAQPLPQRELPRHWIGILLGPVPDVARAQIDIPEGEGVLVRQVVPESPAAKAGLQEFDILLRANDTALADARDLMGLVRDQGASGGEIKLDVLRRGQHQSVTLTPAARPTANDVGTRGGQGWGSGVTMPAMPAMPGVPNFGAGGPHLRMRVPSSVFAQGFSLSQMPSDVSVSIQRQNDGPAHITVKRGNDSWEIVGDDPKSLEQLPDDVRPFVERMLSDGGSPLFQMPSMNRRRGIDAMPGMWGPSGFSNDAMQQQLQRMEEQLQQMRMQLEHDIQRQTQPAVPRDPNDAGDATESDAN